MNHETPQIENKIHLPNSDRGGKSDEFRELIEQYFADGAKASKPWVNLGIDLGTSFSKVVWRLGENEVHPVCFGENKLDLSHYLLPSIVAFEGENLLCGFEAVAFTKYSISNFERVK